MGKIYRSPFRVTVGLSATQLLGPNPRRLGVIINTPPTNRVTLSFSDPAVALDQGITLYPLTQPFQLYSEAVGQAFPEPLFAVSAVAPQDVSGVEILSS